MIGTSDWTGFTSAQGLRLGPFKGVPPCLLSFYAFGVIYAALQYNCCGAIIKGFLRHLRSFFHEVGFRPRQTAELA
jgi:hypothetical protein